MDLNYFYFFDIDAMCGPKFKRKKKKKKKPTQLIMREKQ
jgi:hypothetical protein